MMTLGNHGLRSPQCSGIVPHRERPDRVSLTPLGAPSPTGAKPGGGRPSVAERGGRSARDAEASSGRGYPRRSVRSRVPAALGFALVLGAVALFGKAASPQFHPLPRLVRPPHERLAAADAVAFATVAAISADRYHLDQARVLIGDAPGSFQVKRSPSAPLPVEPEQRVLLFLRGARSPYLALDRAAELTRIEDPHEEDAWAASVRALASDDPGERAELYAGWIEGGSAQRRAIGAAALRDPSARHTELDDSFYTNRARRIWDTSIPLEVRHAWAPIVVYSRPGSVVLVEGASPCREGVDADLFLAALSAARLHQLPQLPALAACGVHHSDPRVQSASKQAAR